MSEDGDDQRPSNLPRVPLGKSIGELRSKFGEAIWATKDMVSVFPCPVTFVDDPLFRDASGWFFRDEIPHIDNRPENFPSKILFLIRMDGRLFEEYKLKMTTEYPLTNFLWNLDRVSNISEGSLKRILLRLLRPSISERPSVEQMFLRRRSTGEPGASIDLRDYIDSGSRGLKRPTYPYERSPLEVFSFLKLTEDTEIKWTPSEAFTVLSNPPFSRMNNHAPLRKRLGLPEDHLLSSEMLTDRFSLTVDNFITSIICMEYDSVSNAEKIDEGASCVFSLSSIPWGCAHERHLLQKAIEFALYSSPSEKGDSWVRSLDYSKTVLTGPLVGGVVSYFSRHFRDRKLSFATWLERYFPQVLTLPIIHSDGKGPIPRVPGAITRRAYVRRGKSSPSVRKSDELILESGQESPEVYSFVDSISDLKNIVEGSRETHYKTEILSSGEIPDQIGDTEWVVNVDQDSIDSSTEIVQLGISHSKDVILLVDTDDKDEFRRVAEDHFNKITTCWDKCSGLEIVELVAGEIYLVADTGIFPRAASQSQKIRSRSIWVVRGTTTELVKYSLPPDRIWMRGGEEIYLTASCFESIRDCKIKSLYNEEMNPVTKRMTTKRGDHWTFHLGLRSECPWEPILHWLQRGMTIDLPFWKEAVRRIDDTLLFTTDVETISNPTGDNYRTAGWFNIFNLPGNHCSESGHPSSSSFRNWQLDHKYLISWRRYIIQMD